MTWFYDIKLINQKNVPNLLIISASEWSWICKNKKLNQTQHEMFGQIYNHLLSHNFQTSAV